MTSTFSASSPARQSPIATSAPHFRRALRRALVIATAGFVTLSVAAVPAAAAPVPDGPPIQLGNKLVKKATGVSANRHLIALQRIAEQNDGTRAANTPGYDASVEYIAGKLTGAGFDVETPEFTYEEEVVDAETFTVAGVSYEVLTMAFSPQTPAGGVTAPLAVVPEDATTGCEAADFATANYAGTITLIRRGGCNFSVKAQNAFAAGAVGVVVSNNELGTVPVNGTLGDEASAVVPTAGLSQNDGTTLATQGGQTATLDLRYHIEERVSRNVIAQTTTGRPNNVVMAGAHLDSVPAGPGINDNGSGSAGLLEVALALGGSPQTNNAVRFAWWGAEELGLLGSQAYVDSLDFEQQLDIALYLNFDMIGSPNAAYFVYDGDNSDAVGAGPGPYGSAQIEETFTSFFSNRLNVPTEGTDFTGRSDYGGFIAVGIPSGGLFTGAEGIKTPEQAAKWGGTAGIAYDPCYHQACDNLGNVNRVAFDRNIDAIAWSVGRYAFSTEGVNGVPPRGEREAARAASRTSSVESSEELAEAA